MSALNVPAATSRARGRRRDAHRHECLAAAVADARAADAGVTAAAAAAVAARHALRRQLPAARRVHERTAAHRSGPPPPARPPARSPPQPPRRRSRPPLPLRPARFLREQFRLRRRRRRLAVLALPVGHRLHRLRAADAGAAAADAAAAAGVLHRHRRVGRRGRAQSKWQMGDFVRARVDPDPMNTGASINVASKDGCDGGPLTNPRDGSPIYSNGLGQYLYHGGANVWHISEDYHFTTAERCPPPPRTPPRRCATRAAPTSRRRRRRAVARLVGLVAQDRRPAPPGAVSSRSHWWLRERRGAHTTCAPSTRRRRRRRRRARRCREAEADGDDSGRRQRQLEAPSALPSAATTWRHGGGRRWRLWRGRRRHEPWRWHMATAASAGAGRGGVGAHPARATRRRAEFGRRRASSPPACGVSCTVNLYGQQTEHVHRMDRSRDLVPANGRVPGCVRPGAVPRAAPKTELAARPAAAPPRQLEAPPLDDAARAVVEHMRALAQRRRAKSDGSDTYTADYTAPRSGSPPATARACRLRTRFRSGRWTLPSALARRPTSTAH